MTLVRFLLSLPMDSLPSLNPLDMHAVVVALYTLEINGADGSLAWDFHDLHRLEYFEHDKEDAKTAIKADPCF